MTELVRFHRFRRRYLALTIGLMMLPTAHAMQELSDHSLSDTTGEGVALVLDNFKMVFQGANDVSAPSSYNVQNYSNLTLNEKLRLSQHDTGFIRIIPTGEDYSALLSKMPSFNSVYQSAYNNQWPITYNNLKTAKYDEVKPGEYTSAYTQIDTTKRDLYTNQEKAFNPGTVAQDRYNEYMNNKYNGIAYLFWGTERKQEAARNDATNDVNNVQKYINEIKTKVNDKIEVEAQALAHANATTIANAYADQNILIQTNLDIKDIVNDTPSLGTRRTKADIFIYGLALSKSDDNLSTRFSNQGFKWGTSDNPWLFRAGTAEGVEQFQSGVKNIGYLALETPLLNKDGTTDSDRFKLGLWADFFSRTLGSSSDVDIRTGAPTSGLDKDYRLRTQIVANGLSFDGSQIRMFRTLGPDPSNPKPEDITDPKQKDYYQTLGLASLIRLNTNPDANGLSFNASSTDLDSRAIRISTATENDLDADFATPAMSVGALAPIFDPNEGLYLYSPNINLVLGNMYQPFVTGSDGKNIVLEITRIPEIPSIYQQIYQNYDGLGTAEFKGSTCNVYQCGEEISVGSKTYQGRNATHSSIAIGTVGPKTPGDYKTLDAKSTPNATGVVFREPQTGNAKNFGSVLIDGVLIQHLKIKTTGL